MSPSASTNARNGTSSDTARSPTVVLPLSDRGDAQHQRTAERRKCRADMQRRGDEESDERQTDDRRCKDGHRRRRDGHGVTAAHEVAREETAQHQPLDTDCGQPRQCHGGAEASERQPACAECEQVGEVGHGQQQRCGVGEVRARIDVWPCAKVEARDGREDDRCEQHHGGVEAEHRRDDACRREDECEQ